MKCIGNSLLLALCLLCQAAWSEVQVQADPVVITEDDTLVLTIRATEGEDLDDVDLAPLQQDFEILHSSRNSSTNFYNGTWSSQSELQLSLAPRRKGQLIIPSMEVDGKRTRPLSIGVNQARQDLDNRQQVFLEAEVDHSEVYVQSQLLYTLRLYQAVNLADLQRSDLHVPGARVEQLETRRFQRSINGSNYMVTELQFALFPDASGPLQIPAMTISATESNGRRSLFDRGRPLRRRSQPIDVKVLPIPAEFPGDNWLPSPEVSISEDWSADPGTLKIGESVTRTITIRALGVAAAQIAPIPPESVPGLKTYPDQPGIEELKQEGGITALSVQSTALLATQPGDFVLPELRLPWWDTRTRSLRYAVLPARTIGVAAPTISELQPGTPPQTSHDSVDAARLSPTPGTGSNPLWMWSTMAALLGWGLTTALLLRNRRNATPREESQGLGVDREKAAFKLVLEACRNSDAQRARGLLLDWGDLYFGPFSPGRKPDLRGVGARLDSEPLQKEIAELEKTLYGASANPWVGNRLAAEISDWRRKQPSRREDRSSRELPPLYG